MDDAYDEQPILSLETSIESNDADVPPPAPFTLYELKKMKVVELKALLTEQKIRTSGKKHALIRRLSESYNSNASLLGDNELQALDYLIAESPRSEVCRKTFGCLQFIITQRRSI